MRVMTSRLLSFFLFVLFVVLCLVCGVRGGGELEMLQMARRRPIREKLILGS